MQMCIPIAAYRWRDGDRSKEGERERNTEADQELYYKCNVAYAYCLCKSLYFAHFMCVSVRVWMAACKYAYGEEIHLFVCTAQSHRFGDHSTEW